MTPAQADAALFGELLTLRESRAAVFEAQAASPQSALHAEALLRALAVIDDAAPPGDEGDTQADPVLQRLEAKLDVLTLLVAASPMSGHGPSRTVELEWSARGAALDVADAPPVGTQGRLRIAASDWLPTPLVLPAIVVASDQRDGNVTRIWLRFESLSQALGESLEKHVFRIHRREVAAHKAQAV